MPAGTPPSRSWWAALLTERCPRCRFGSVFRGPLTMNETCPACGLRFGREPGYFLGAMYFSYALGIPVLGLLLLGAWLHWPDWPLHLLLGVALVGFVPPLPVVFRYSRLSWMYFDQAFDPPDEVVR